MPIKTLFVHAPGRSPAKRLQFSLALEGLEVLLTDVARAVETATAVDPHVIVLDAALGTAVAGELAGSLRQAPEVARTPVFLIRGEGDARGTVADWETPTSGGRPWYAVGPGLWIAPVRLDPAARHPEPEVAAADETEASVEVLVVTLAAALVLVDCRAAGSAAQPLRVAQMALRLNAAGGGPCDRRTLVLSALLHDVSKAVLPAGLLDKVAPLNVKEWFRLYTNPLDARALLEPIPFLCPAVPPIESLHEHWDGHGYPAGLAGEGIPVAARMVAICEAHDAMGLARHAPTGGGA